MNSFQVLGDCVVHQAVYQQKKMLITARESVCCPLLKLALSVSSGPNIILTREMSGAVEQTFQCDPTTAVANLQTSFYH